MGQPEASRTILSSGVIPSEKLLKMGESYPFTRQLDIVFPSSPILESALSGITAQYLKVKVELAELVDKFRTSSSALQTGQGVALAVSISSSDESWCIDPQGVLSIFMGKETYQRFGLFGERVPYGSKDNHVVHVNLRDLNAKDAVTAKQKDALLCWDKRRGSPWDALVYDPDHVLFPNAEPSAVSCVVRKSANIRIPLNVVASSAEEPGSTADGSEQEQTSAIFEWIALAVLGSQRLSATDRVDPYIAVYEPPEPCRVGEVTHVRWRGLITPAFVQQVIHAVSLFLGSNDVDSQTIVSVISHAFPTSPVTYIPMSALSPNASAERALERPVRMPREDAESTWCLVLQPTSGDAPGENDEEAAKGMWMLAESVGKWDARWG